MSRTMRQAVIFLVAAVAVFGGIYWVARPNNSGAGAGQAPDPALQQQIKDLEGKIRNSPKDVGLLTDLAHAYFNAGQLTQAGDTYKKALDLDPQNTSLHVDYGVNFFYQAKTSEALAEYRKAIEIDPKFVPAHYYLAVALSHGGDTAGGLAEYQKVVELGPGTAFATKAQTAIDQAKGNPAASGTPRVPASATPSSGTGQATTGKVGATLSADGLAVTVDSVKDWPGDGTIKPADGKKLVQIKATIANQADKVVPVAADRFAIADASGMTSALTASYSDRFPTKDLAKGDAASGVVVFEVSADAKALTVLYKLSTFGSTFLSFDSQ